MTDTNVIQCLSYDDNGTPGYTYKVRIDTYELLDTISHSVRHGVVSLHIGAVSHHIGTVSHHKGADSYFIVQLSCCIVSWHCQLFYRC